MILNDELINKMCDYSESEKEHCIVSVGHLIDTIDAFTGTIADLKRQLAERDAQLAALAQQNAGEREQQLREALQGILEIGKRDLSNPKYDGYFKTAREALELERAIPEAQAAPSDLPSHDELLGEDLR